MITAPSIFGKLPALGDFVRHNAPLDQVQAWRSWFDHRDGELLARAASHSAGGGVRHWLHLTPPSLSVQSRLRPSEPCLFILRPCGLQFPSESSYLLGVLAASHDRVGRRYPLVVWQAASAQWAGHILAAPAQWLTDLVQIVHGHTHTADRTGLAAAVDALWARHRPGWRERVQRSLRRLADASRPGASGDGVIGPKSTRDDWPPGLLRDGSLGSVWQSAAHCAIEIDGVASIRRIVAGL
ncbi:Type VI secretion system-associated protein TagF [Cupriavidus necator]|uniref:TagF domain-containing protein n=1 Tax=Cupriavidus necator TaxID=106590 RepID=UPI003F741506